MPNSLTNKTFILAALISAGFVLSACEEEGPAERMGRQLDDAAEEMQDEMEDLADEMEEIDRQ